MIKNPDLRQPIGEKKDSTLPGMYDSNLFEHGRRNSKYKKSVEMTDTKKGIELLDQMNALLKAGMSAGRETMPSESQAKRETDNSYSRFASGVSGDPTPDLPERGKDWHGTVPGVKDEPQDKPDDDFNKEPVNILDLFKPKQANADAQKSFAAMPMFEAGPVIPPREIDFLARQGYSPDEIHSGLVRLTPNMRSQFNYELQGAVQKSIETFLDKVK